MSVVPDARKLRGAELAQAIKLLSQFTHRSFRLWRKYVDIGIESKDGMPVAAVYIRRNSTCFLLCRIGATSLNSSCLNRLRVVAFCFVVMLLDMSYILTGERRWVPLLSNAAYRRSCITNWEREIDFRFRQPPIQEQLNWCSRFVSTHVGHLLCKCEGTEAKFQCASGSYLIY
jgi:hypothetical protein